MVTAGLLDSGINPDSGGPVITAGAAFFVDDDNALRQCATRFDHSGHASALASIIRYHSPDVQFLDAQVFFGRRPGTAVAVAAGLDWLVAQGAAVINLSFGLRADRKVLRDACQAAIDAGRILIAASPAQGQRVWPAAYPGVISVTGDARCRVGELSVLGAEPVVFGACVGGPDHRPHESGGGASFAVAHVTGLVCAYLGDQGRAEGLVEYLHSLCVYHGRECRR